MPLTRRYLPEHAPGDSGIYAMSFDHVLPEGANIVLPSLVIFTNTQSPAPSTDFAIGIVYVQGRTIYASVAGGISGTDYQLRWTVSGTRPDGSAFTFTRTALVLCAPTS